MERAREAGERRRKKPPGQQGPREQEPNHGRGKRGETTKRRQQGERDHRHRPDGSIASSAIDIA
ncbi:MAG: hypothetical protein IPI18_02325 [Saprospiraceae bacterium]|nr:hypothetical protein [Saprospiraceae bacterium]